MHWKTKKKHFRGKSETELAHVQSFIDFIKKIKKKKLHRSISVHWKTKKKKTFRGNNETEVAHVQSFTDFNPKKKKKKLHRRFREDISVSILPNRGISVKLVYAYLI